MTATRNYKRTTIDKYSMDNVHTKISASGFYIERELLTYLEDYASISGCSKHEAMRQALIQFMERNPVQSDSSKEKFLDYEIRIDNLLRSMNTLDNELMWKVNLHTQSSRIIYRYDLNKCPFCGELAAVIELIEDMGMSSASATISGKHTPGTKCQDTLNQLLFPDR